MNTQKLTKANIGAKSFAGYLDTMIFPNSTLGDDDVCLSHSHIELKSPFSSLLQTQPGQHVDQLIAETACVSAMKAAAKASENGGTSSNSTAARTVGALTDLFALHLIYQSDWENKHYYISNFGFLEPRAYIQQLLVLCLESSAVCSLAAASVTVNDTLTLEDGQESEQNDSKCGQGDVDEAQQQQPEGGGLKRGSTGDGWEGNAINNNAGRAYHKHATISFKYEAYEDDIADQLEFLRQYEMRRMGVTLTRANLALLGGTR